MGQNSWGEEWGKCTRTNEVSLAVGFPDSKVPVLFVRARFSFFPLLVLACVGLERLSLRKRRRKKLPVNPISLYELLGSIGQNSWGKNRENAPGQMRCRLQWVFQTAKFRYCLSERGFHSSPYWFWHVSVWRDL
ncbi:hypothetical protein CDAR_69301 [Caerostris darwini]|uniref:Uncharacterized protein n=1 Tax=Caerostris darwini TaxID=1538125 RepID=A0AAV4U0N9_9ARAC|nr:hypothetical protein CDAR_69301 [Caerostris darwini]